MYIYWCREQTAAATGRIQCRAPNLQALPKRPVQLSASKRVTSSQELFDDGDNSPESPKNFEDAWSIKLNDAEESILVEPTNGVNFIENSDIMQNPDKLNTKHKTANSSNVVPGIMASSSLKTFDSTVNVNQESNKISSPKTFDSTMNANSESNKLLASTNVGSPKPGSPSPAVTPHNITARNALCSEAGYLLVSADFQQMELRLLAHFSQDSVLLQAFRTHQDVFTTLATKL